jgi:lipopolysaccharide biosynthesis glycosyltransferase
MVSNEKIIPSFDGPSTNIVLSSDENYEYYLGVCIKSIIENASSSINYDIYILDGGITEYTKKIIFSFQNKNISIKFIDVNPFIEKVDKNIFFINYQFTIAAYYRLFLPIIFSEFEKMIYIDCDTVVLSDISEANSIDIEDCYFGVTRDIFTITSANKDKNSEMSDYLYKKLKLKNHINYFQSGFMVWNIQRCIKDNLTELLILKLKEVKTPKYVDQCILNSVCESKVKFIPYNWNYTWHIDFMNAEFRNSIPEPESTAFRLAKDNPYVVHFTANGKKPWLDPGLDGSEYFWKYARLTPFYEQIIYKNLKLKTVEIKKKSRFKKAIKRTIYLLLSRITMDESRLKYAEKIKKYK